MEAKWNFKGRIFIKVRNGSQMEFLSPVGLSMGFVRL